MAQSIKSFAVCLVLIFISVNVFAVNSLQYSKQLLVVTGTNMQLWQRTTTTAKWHKISRSFPVVIGKNGSTKNKHEGDNKTPEGIFPISTAFGIAPYSHNLTHEPYIQVTPTTQCVDDPRSKFYNQIVNSKKIAEPDWHSAEQMHHYQVNYRYGLVVDYNSHPARPGHGSCIFIHVWKNSHTGTAGCVAMPQAKMRAILAWLKPQDKPMILIRES